jgi:hypothetical protein
MWAFHLLLQACKSQLGICNCCEQGTALRFRGKPSHVQVAELLRRITQLLQLCAKHTSIVS